MSHLTPYDFAYREMLSRAGQMTMGHGTAAALARDQAHLALIPVMLMVKSTTQQRRS